MDFRRKRTRFPCFRKEEQNRIPLVARLPVWSKAFEGIQQQKKLVTCCDAFNSFAGSLCVNIYIQDTTEQKISEYAALHHG